MEQKNVRLDHNWITPSALAAELGIEISTVTNWIARNQIDFIVFPEVKRRKHLVDRRTAPGTSGKGRPRNNPEKAN